MGVSGSAAIYYGLRSIRTVSLLSRWSVSVRFLTKNRGYFRFSAFDACP
jgi:hypothetical protein